jgi:hypothetical protein
MQQLRVLLTSRAAAIMPLAGLDDGSARGFHSTALVYCLCPQQKRRGGSSGLAKITGLSAALDGVSGYRV